MGSAELQAVYPTIDRTLYFNMPHIKKQTDPILNILSRAGAVAFFLLVIVASVKGIIWLASI